MTPTNFELVLMTADTSSIPEFVDAGIDAIAVDWEYRGKEDRQTDADTQINKHSYQDLLKVRATTSATVICRLNRSGPWTSREVEEALEAGADEILLPMVTSVEEIQEVIDYADGRCGVGVMIETTEAVALSGELSKLPVARAYVGLNDLAISRRSATIFEAVVDGTVELVRRQFTAPFGFGGLTLPGGGSPIPSSLLIAETARIGCNFGLLRRSFMRDIKDRDPRIEIARLKDTIRAYAERPPEEVQRDRLELEEAVAAWSSGTLESTR